MQLVHKILGYQLKEKQSFHQEQFSGQQVPDTNCKLFLIVKVIGLYFLAFYPSAPLPNMNNSNVKK